MRRIVAVKPVKAAPSYALWLARTATDLPVAILSNEIGIRKDELYVGGWLSVGDIYRLDHVRKFFRDLNWTPGVECAIAFTERIDEDALTDYERAQGYHRAIRTYLDAIPQNLDQWGLWDLYRWMTATYSREQRLPDWPGGKAPWRTSSHRDPLPVPDHRFP